MTPRRGNLVGFLHRQHEIRHANLPAVGELRRRWHIGRVAFFGAAIHPRRDRLNLFVGQTPIVREARIVRIGQPGGHAPFDNHPLDGSCPRPRVLVGQERHRRDFAGTMTVDAIGVDDGRDILTECHVVHRGVRAVAVRSFWLFCPAIATGNNIAASIAARTPMNNEASHSVLLGICLSTSIASFPGRSCIASTSRRPARRRPFPSYECGRLST